MTKEQAQKVDELLQRSELDQESQALMRSFFESISGESQFDRMIELLGKFPTLFENFCKCFILKKQFLDSGATEEEWNEYLAKENEIFSQIER